MDGTYRANEVRTGAVATEKEARLGKQLLCAQRQLSLLKGEFERLKQQLALARPVLEPSHVRAAEVLCNLLLSAIHKTFLEHKSVESVELSSRVVGVLDVQTHLFRSVDEQRKRLMTDLRLATVKLDRLAFNSLCGQIESSKFFAPAQKDALIQLKRHAAPLDLKFLHFATDDDKWLSLVDWWQKAPLPLRYIVVATGELHWLAYFQLWRQASADLRFIAVAQNDPRWLHMALRWDTIPLREKLKAISCPCSGFEQLRRLNERTATSYLKEGPRNELFDCPPAAELVRLVPLPLRHRADNRIALSRHSLLRASPIPTAPPTGPASFSGSPNLQAFEPFFGEDGIKKTAEELQRSFAALSSQRAKDEAKEKAREREVEKEWSQKLAVAQRAREDVEKQLQVVASKLRETEKSSADKEKAGKDRELKLERKVLEAEKSGNEKVKEAEKRTADTKAELSAVKQELERHEKNVKQIATEKRTDVGKLEEELKASSKRIAELESAKSVKVNEIGKADVLSKPKLGSTAALESPVKKPVKEMPSKGVVVKDVPVKEKSAAKEVSPGIKAAVIVKELPGKISLVKESMMKPKGPSLPPSNDVLSKSPESKPPPPTLAPKALTPGTVTPQNKSVQPPLAASKPALAAATAVVSAVTLASAAETTPTLKARALMPAKPMPPGKSAGGKETPLKPAIPKEKEATLKSVGAPLLKPKPDPSSATSPMPPPPKTPLSIGPKPTAATATAKPVVVPAPKPPANAPTNATDLALKKEATGSTNINPPLKKSLPVASKAAAAKPVSAGTSTPTPPPAPSQSSLASPSSRPALAPTSAAVEAALAKPALSKPESSSLAKTPTIKPGMKAVAEGSPLPVAAPAKSLTTPSPLPPKPKPPVPTPTSTKEPPRIPVKDTLIKSLKQASQASPMADSKADPKKDQKQESVLSPPPTPHEARSSALVKRIVANGPLVPSGTSDQLTSIVSSLGAGVATGRGDFTSKITVKPPLSSAKPSLSSAKPPLPPAKLGVAGTLSAPPLSEAQPPPLIRKATQSGDLKMAGRSKPFNPGEFLRSLTSDLQPKLALPPTPTPAKPGTPAKSGASGKLDVSSAEGFLARGLPPTPSASPTPSPSPSPLSAASRSSDSSEPLQRTGQLKSPGAKGGPPPAFFKALVPKAKMPMQ